MSFLALDDTGQVRSEPPQEQRIERLVSEIGQVIGEAPPERREELRQMASDLLNQEAVDSGPTGGQETNRRYIPRLSGLALSGFALILGVGLFIFLPWIGFVLVWAGIVGFILSFIYNALRER